MGNLRTYSDLADYRRRVQEMYAGARGRSAGSKNVWEIFRAQRESLFQEHPQSALDRDQRDRFVGLPYFDYKPGLRVLAEVEVVVDEEPLVVRLDQDGQTRLQRFGRARFWLDGKAAALTLFWIEGYGGGVFLPFRDETRGEDTYSGGRYLLDTIKGADLGREDSAWVLDFNYAYNPSCAYNARWSCPLAPPENWLEFKVPAGEMLYPEAK